jgi:hypothetical protein
MNKQKLLEDLQNRIEVYKNALQFTMITLHKAELEVRLSVLNDIKDSIEQGYYD